MNLRELDSFKMADAVTFHAELNPKLWNNNNLRPEVKQQLILIAEDFLSELGIQNVDVDDITVSGSNAAFSYTPHSDLDLHLLIDMSRFDEDIYKEFFNAKKALYNEAHHITIHGVPVEVYVQDSREPVVSLGEYSVMQDKWLRLPTKRRANFDQTTTKAKYNTLKDLIELALQSKNLKKVEKITNKIRQYRQAGLDKGGEFGPENLAYKALRSQGYITKLYDLRDKLHSEILTIETMYQNPEQMVEEEKSDLPSKVYHVTPASNLDSIMQAGLRPQVGSRSSKIPGEQSAIYCFPDKASLEDAMMNWLDDEFDEDEELALLEIDTTNLTGEYSPNAEFEIVITSLIPPNRIKVLSSNLDTITESSEKKTENEIHNYSKLDHILKKLCEMVIKGQQSDKEYGMVAACVVDPNNNLIAGLNRPGNDGKRIHAERVAIEKYEQQYGNIPAGSIIVTTLSPCNETDDDTAEDRVGESCAKYLNNKGIKKVYCGYIDPTQDNDIREFNLIETGDKKIREECKKFADTFLKLDINEASGYIPSEKEKNDPRFKTALTVDIKPDSIKKNAKSFYWNTSRAGIPPTARPDGKF